ncbi:acetolactate decarboxylase [Pendulispora albinea]|uniref:Alpha-acetolactate decarboxylase n=1 Tax=Pendulispora albinea TaxID=2741071 RepID=A0ABZ2LZ55_9BACT
MTKGILWMGAVVSLLAAGSAIVAGEGCTRGARSNAVLYHASFRGAYLAGVYDGVIPMERLAEHGDFGLGATDGNDGELVALKGTFWRSRADGTMIELGPTETTPYAMMTFFRPQRTITFEGPLTSEQFEKTLDAQLDPGHRIYAVRIRGRFAHVEAGNGDKQEKPYRPLEDVLREYRYRDHAGTEGTLVGFRCPAYMKRFDRVGYHFHYLSDDRKAGGHVRSYVIDDVDVSIQELPAFTVDQPRAGEFYERDLETER